MTAFVLAAALAATGPAQKFEKDVAKAREKAIDYLKKQQTKDGHWEGIVIGFLADMEGGSTALVTLALLEAGVPAKDEAVAKAIEYLAKLPPKKTYVVSLQTQVLARADAKGFAKQIQANTDWLANNALRRAKALAGWSYPQNDIADGSNTHYAVMGLHAAAQAGAKVDAEVWKEIREMYARTQLKGGTWLYYNEAKLDQGSVSMTGAALVGLSIAARYEKAEKPDPAFEKGMAAYVPMGLESAKSAGYNMMVAAELGRLLGGREFKSGDQTRSWYRNGVEKLLKEQKDDGSWALGKNIDGTPHLATAFGLYFLGPPPKS